MARRPIPGGDAENWGIVLNEYLARAHKPDGTLRADVRTVAELRAIDVAEIPDQMQALVGGYNTFGDRGGGHFFYERAATDADDAGTIIAPNSGSGRWKRMYAGFLWPEMFGAVGDGVTDDSSAVQAAVDAAEARQNQSLLLAPAVSYGLAKTVEFGAGSNDVIAMAGSASVSGKTSMTFRKLANVTAIRVVHKARSQPTLHRIGVIGRGAHNPETTDPADDSTPGIVLHSRAFLDCPKVIHTGGMVGGEPNTKGYAIGIFQMDGGNVNLTRVENAVVRRIRGDGIYIGRADDSSSRDCNAIVVSASNISGITGYGVNAEDGFRNQFYVQHFSQKPATALGVFQMLYVENFARLLYCEGGTDTLVNFGTSGARNKVATNYTGTTPVLAPDIRNNIIEELVTGAVWVGDGTAPNDPGVYGSAGYTVDRLRLPNSAGDNYSAISVADDFQCGTAVDIVAGSSAGDITWTIRDAEAVRLGRLVTISLDLAGRPNGVSPKNARLKFDNRETKIAIRNGSQGGVIGPLFLINSEGRWLVYLVFRSVDQFQIVDASGASMSFSDVVGQTTFSLAGTITFLSR